MASKIWVIWALGIHSISSVLIEGVSLISKKNRTQFEVFKKKSIKTSTSHNGLLFHRLVLHNGRFSSVAHTKNMLDSSSAQFMYKAVVFLLGVIFLGRKFPTKVARK